MMRKGIDMSRYITSLKQQAAQKPQRIVLPESDDIRILQAADRVLAEQLAIPVLWGRTATYRNWLHGISSIWKGLK